MSNNIKPSEIILPEIKETIINISKSKGIDEKELTNILDNIRLEEPPSLKMGDYSTNVSFRLAKLFKKSPKDIGEEIGSELSNSESIKKIVKKIEVINGYINFFIDYNLFSNIIISDILSKKEKYGKGNNKRVKIILEHTSANPNGPLHIGHSRNAIVGDSLKRLLIFAGYDVETQYYVNDMGRQEAIVVFGLSKFSLDKSKKNDHGIGEVYVKANRLLEENPELEEEILKIMKEYEESCEKNEDNALVEKFKFAVNYALDGFKETLENLNIKHDKFVWESNYVRNGMVKEVIRKLIETGKVIEDEVLKLDLSDFGIEKKLVLARLNGTSLYSTRDIAYHIDKMSNCDIGIDVLGADHKLTGEMVKCSLKLLGYNTPEIIFYEFISLPEGSMSTRRGRFISLDELYSEALKRSYDEVKRRKNVDENEIEKVSKKIAVGAVRYNIIRISPDKPMVFRWEEALDFDKVGCPVIQYAHARCCRILEETVGNDDIMQPIENYELNQYEKNLIKILSKFPKIVEKSSKVRKPQNIAIYAMDVAQSFNSFYGNCPILKEERDDVKQFRLNLVKSTKIVIENALGILGIECPGKM